MKTFEFSGEIEASKSLMNRALVVQSYRADFAINSESQSRDVVHLKLAMQNLNSPLFQVGEGGTTFRFLVLRKSRDKGVWNFHGTSRLMARPSLGLDNLLSQLGVHITFRDQENYQITSNGWSFKNPIKVDLSQSSQFASALLLNCWNLDQDLEMQLSEKKVSDGYFEMTIQFLQQCGMVIEQFHNSVLIRKNQSVQISECIIEPDISSAFVVAALAAVRGHCKIHKFPHVSLQPDFEFINFFKKMKIPLELNSSVLTVGRAEKIEPLQASLRNCPDLFPVLSVILSKADGVSHLYDAPQLVHKESNRLLKTSELLKLMKVNHEIYDDGIKISGSKHHHEFFDFNPDQDHRLAFAAAVAKSMGYRLRILHPEVVDKSFPQFWSLISGGPG
ncbi:MAG: 3-phosphoshikimate 1-carboxyvinyltransferase [Bdellovibrionales bacterium]